MLSIIDWKMVYRLDLDDERHPLGRLAETLASSGHLSQAAYVLEKIPVREVLRRECLSILVALGMKKAIEKDGVVWEANDLAEYDIISRSSGGFWKGKPLIFRQGKSTLGAERFGRYYNNGPVRKLYDKRFCDWGAGVGRG